MNNEHWAAETKQFPTPPAPSLYPPAASSFQPVAPRSFTGFKILIGLTLSIFVLSGVMTFLYAGSSAKPEQHMPIAPIGATSTPTSKSKPTSTRQTKTKQSTTKTTTPKRPNSKLAPTTEPTPHAV